MNGPWCGSGAVQSETKAGPEKEDFFFSLICEYISKKVLPNDSFWGEKKTQLVRHVPILQSRKWRQSDLPQISQLVSGRAETRKPGGLMP